jgi:hypothetical protein
MEKISRTDRVRNVVLQRVEEIKDILHTMKRMTANSIGHNLRGKCLLKYVIEGNAVGRIEVAGRRRRRCMKLLNHLRKREDTGN